MATLEELEQRVDDLNGKLLKILKKPQLPDHYHNGFDVSRVNFIDIYQRKAWIPWTIAGTSADISGNYGVFLNNQIGSGLVNGFWASHQVAGSDGGAVNLQLEKLTGTQAPDAGATLLSVGINLKGTANTVVSGTLTSTLTNRNIALGDRLALRDSGTLTALSNVSVLVEILLT